MMMIHVNKVVELKTLVIRIKSSDHSVTILD